MRKLLIAAVVLVGGLVAAGTAKAGGVGVYLGGPGYYGGYYSGGYYSSPYGYSLYTPVYPAPGIGVYYGRPLGGWYRGGWGGGWNGGWNNHRHHHHHGGRGHGHHHH